MKDQKWTVVREKHHEDRGHGKMCGKEATGVSGAVGQDGAEQTGVLPAGTIPTTVLPALVEQVDNATGLPVGPTLPTEVNETNVDEQQEQVHGDDTGSSNVGAGSGQNVDANNVRVTGAEEVIEPTIRGLVEAMQIMGAQIASLTQAFTPLVNSSVGQANPPVRVAAGVADVKGISQLRLNQDMMETRVKELAGNSWRSAPSGERCVLVRISVGESGTVTGRADGPGAGRFDQVGLRLGTGSGQASREEKGRNRQWAVMGRLWDGFGKKGCDWLVTVRPGGWGQFKSSSPSHFCHSGRFLLNLTQRETQRKFKRERETQTLDWPI
ncbi:hypothetical protein IGI04_024306 [Brassica rapa subsp. trilocularis]|uniref:Uncharacterized protein n=1 Tax=Brassica rapa subsp. trilocularis TaxID=1813537 RepID=A0ABQ7M6B8_BRACM|nr:hypothetical protein IGI04_024306 [Brassica rapa subsp. trilocularis]